MVHSKLLMDDVCDIRNILPRSRRQCQEHYKGQAISQSICKLQKSVLYQTLSTFGDQATIKLYHVQVSKPSVGSNKLIDIIIGIRNLNHGSGRFLIICNFNQIDNLVALYKWERWVMKINYTYNFSLKSFFRLKNILKNDSINVTLAFSNINHYSSNIYLKST